MSTLEDRAQEYKIILNRFGYEASDFADQFGTYWTNDDENLVTIDLDYMVWNADASTGRDAASLEAFLQERA